MVQGADGLDTCEADWRHDWQTYALVKETVDPFLGCSIEVAGIAIWAGDDLASGAFQGSLFSNAFIEGAITSLPDWLALSDPDLQKLSDDIVGIFTRFQPAKPLTRLRLKTILFGGYRHHHSQRKPLAKSRSEKRPTVNVQSPRNSLSQWPTRAIAGANRRK
jgi:hypothetical protein